MKIILEGTEAELRSVLHSFDVSGKVVSDNGSQFLCGDITGKSNKRKTAERTFAEFKAIAQNRLNDFCGNDKTERSQRVELNSNFMSDSGNNKIKALAKEQANRRREVRQQLNSLSEQAIPEAVVNYFNGNKLSVSFEKR